MKGVKQEKYDLSNINVDYIQAISLNDMYTFLDGTKGNIVCTIINVATIMKRSVKSISPTRGQLIDKGLVHATGHAEIDFTVPQFDKFIRRINPTLEITE